MEITGSIYTQSIFRKKPMTSKTVEQFRFATANLQAGEYRIHQGSNGRFLDAHESSTHDFSVVTRPLQNDPTQTWIVKPSGGMNEFTIQQKSNGRFLDAHESSANDFSVVTRPSQNNSTQIWVIKPSGGNNRFTIQQKSNGRFLDAHESSAQDFSVVTRPSQNNTTQLWGFNPPNTLKVLSPNDSQDFDYDAENRIVIDIRFSHPVQKSSVVVRNTLVLKTDKVANANGTLIWSADRKTVKFTSQKSKRELLDFNHDGRFTLILNSAVNQKIKDDRGTSLDGNADGIEGGVFRQDFISFG